MFSPTSLFSCRLQKEGEAEEIKMENAEQTDADASRVPVGTSEKGITDYGDRMTRNTSPDRWIDR